MDQKDCLDFESGTGALHHLQSLYPHRCVGSNSRHQHSASHGYLLHKRSRIPSEEEQRRPNCFCGSENRYPDDGIEIDMFAGFGVSARTLHHLESESLSQKSFDENILANDDAPIHKEVGDGGGYYLTIHHILSELLHLGLFGQAIIGAQS